MRYREVALREVLSTLQTTSSLLTREGLGEKYGTNGRRLTEKQLARFAVYFDKEVAKVQKRVDKVNERNKLRAKAAKKGIKRPAPAHLFKKKAKK